MIKKDGNISIVDNGMGNIDKWCEIICGDITINYDANWRKGKFKGITVDIIDPKDNISDNLDFSTSYMHDIASNIDPCAELHQVDGNYQMQPCEPYKVDNFIATLDFKRIFKGNYMGNIIINDFNSDSKMACFVSQESNGTQIYRYYRFLDLTGIDILTGSEYDLDDEYLLGYSYKDYQKHQMELSRRLEEMALMPSKSDFTVILHENGDEELIDYKGEGVTEEGIRKFEEFQRNVLNILKKGYELLQIPYITTNRNTMNKSKAKRLKGIFSTAAENELDNTLNNPE